MAASPVMEERHMMTIILEGVLFAALVAAVGTLFYMVLMYATPLGTRVRQTRNRRRLDHAADLTCPIHGPHSTLDLVRLTSGESMCPECYKETLNG
jgi:hypothetical protein